MSSIIRVKELCKKYGDLLAVDNIDFEVRKGDFFAFLGPNGAGKSTTIKMISTLLKQTAGEIMIDGMNIDKEPTKVREILGTVFQESLLDDKLTVIENLYVRGSFYGLSKKNVLERLKHLESYISFEDILDKKVETLSGGQRRKSDILRGLIHTPKILILDEPTTGLDPFARKEIWNCVTNLKNEKGLTVFLTTHYMEEVTDADQVVIMNHGKVVEIGTPYELKKKYVQDKLKLWGNQSLIDVLNEQGHTTMTISDYLMMTIDSPFEGLEIVQNNRETIESFEILKGSMDDVFLKITGERLGD